MPAGSRTSFQKRQKEIARMEKQREKAAKRLERKRLKDSGAPGDAALEEPRDEASEPAEPTGLDEQ